MHHAKINSEEEFLAWGTGSPLREFLFVDDLSNVKIFIENDLRRGL